MKSFHLYLVSDATGETLNSLANAAIAQFSDAQPIHHKYALVRNTAQIDRVLQAVAVNPGMVMFTLVDTELRDRLREGCRNLQVPCLPVLDPILAAFSSFLGAESQARPGVQHEMGEEYQRRIEAINFTLAHDDGQSAQHLLAADVVLVGVSRTSKTPTCIYLANRGVKAANVPIVPKIGLPPALTEKTEKPKPLIVGLTASPDRLVQIRRNRLLSLNATAETDYVDMEAVKEEVTHARRLFTRQGWPVIDVTRRSIEETAAQVLDLLDRRVEGQGRNGRPAAAVES
jgi:[pyruvate, water dikinase]-phosphate phosphotransferase / [pyruvate, water dikinase] kinase